MTQAQSTQAPQAQQQTPASSNAAATATAALTPESETAPVVVQAEAELSGAQWISRFPTSASTVDLASPFRENVVSFISALQAAGATVTVSATQRPPERAYLMHWSWKISKQNYDPQTVPSKDGVNINWVHKDAQGNYSAQASKTAATAMVNGYGMQNLGVAPSLSSRHIEGNAIDMNISWSGTLTIAKAAAAGNEVIETTPRSGMNATLHTVGAGYSVIKYSGSGTDEPHWSTDGR